MTPRSEVGSSDFLKVFADNLRAQNPAMSLRAVARRLDISPSYWSKILAGKKMLSPSLLPKVSKVLKLDLLQLGELQKLLLMEFEQLNFSPETGLRTFKSHSSKSEVYDYKESGKPEFWILEEWYYIPILNLITCSDFEFDIELMSKRLGLAPEIIHDAITSLFEGGLLQLESSGNISRTNKKIRFPTTESHESVRRHHQQMINKSIDHLSAFEGEGFQQRLITGINFAGDSKKLKEARHILETSLYEVANLLADSETTDEVYQLNLQLFPITRPSK